jgi:hypothetical protein
MDIDTGHSPQHRPNNCTTSTFSSLTPHDKSNLKAIRLLTREEFGGTPPLSAPPPPVPFPFSAPCADSTLNSPPSRPSCHTSESTSPSVQRPPPRLLLNPPQAPDSGGLQNQNKQRPPPHLLWKPPQAPDSGGLQNSNEHAPALQCKKKRGIFKQWATDADVAYQASLHQDTVQLISKLASTSINILYNQLVTPSFSVLRASSIPSDQSRGGNSLGEIAGRIRNLEKKGFDLDFEIAISLIQFALKLDVLQEENEKDFKTLVREEIQSGGLVGCTERQGKRWRAWGYRLVEFAGAGKSWFSIGTSDIYKRNSLYLWPHYPCIGQVCECIQRSTGDGVEGDLRHSPFAQGRCASKCS